MSTKMTKEQILKLQSISKKKIAKMLTRIRKATKDIMIETISENEPIKIREKDEEFDENEWEATYY